MMNDCLIFFDDSPPDSDDEIFRKGNAYSFGRHAWAASIAQKSCTAKNLERLAVDKLLLGTSIISLYSFAHSQFCSHVLCVFTTFIFASK